jgi:3-deoxy-D-manno-octulosonic-acid transferase
VGETVAAIPLIKALQARYPDVPVLITNMTITGAARTKAVFGETVLQTYVPYDLPDVMNRFLKRVNPIIAIIMETELWPNFFAACQKRHIPIVVTNARLSEHSAQGYRRFAELTQQILQSIHVLAVQTTVEADRFVSLGLQKEKAVVTGNLKFDLEPPADLAENSKQLRAALGTQRFVWIAASTHAGEEEMALKVHRRILEQFPQALLMLVPRHPERFNAVFTVVEQQGFRAIRRSQNTECTDQTQVYLGDTMGEMLLLYAASDIAFIGGSFVPIGGHNMLEASVLGKPVITGPYLFNFAEISQSLIAAKGMIKVETEEALFKQVLQMLQDSQHRNTIGENGRQFVAANRGALAKQLNLITSIIDSVA